MVTSARSETENLRHIFEERIKAVEKTSEEKIKAVEKTSEEKIKTSEERIKTIEKTSEERIKAVGKTSEEKIKTAKAEAAKQAIDDYLKYNHSEEYKALRKATEMADLLRKE